MSEVSILSGGAVEVDTESLRAAAAAVRRVETDLLDAETELRAASAAAAGDVFFTVTLETHAVAAQVAPARETAAALAAALEDAALRYEAIELTAERSAAAAAGDTARSAAAGRALAGIRVTRPDVVAAAEEAGARVRGHDELLRQAIAAGFGTGMTSLPVALWAVLGLIRRWGGGPIPRSARLTGAAPEVAITPHFSEPVTAPVDLADAAARVPGGGEGRVRVEAYAQPDGSVEYAVYIAGTQGAGGDEAFDDTSNLQLYAGQRSASYEAVRQALADAGASPGDVVHAIGHSQGAMVAEWLALEGEYDVQTLVSFGGPVQADTGPGTLSVAFRHTDDPVAALQAGGWTGTVGGPGSFVAERVADPTPGVQDLAFAAHRMSAYERTAREVDGSGDPRVAAVHGVFAGLGVAGAGTATIYSAAKPTRPVTRRDGGGV